MTQILNVVMVEDAAVEAEIIARQLKKGGLQCAMVRVESETAAFRGSRNCAAYALSEPQRTAVDVFPSA